MRIERKTLLSIIAVISSIIVIISLNGCKKSEPSTTEPSTVTNQQMAQTETPTTPSTTATVEQTICPVMENPINKDIYVEYLGKKVYFCCKECEEKFMEEPEKYLDKLPQFQE